MLMSHNTDDPNREKMTFFFGSEHFREATGHSDGLLSINSKKNFVYFTNGYLFGACVVSY